LLELQVLNDYLFIFLDSTSIPAGGLSFIGKDADVTLLRTIGTTLLSIVLTLRTIGTTLSSIGMTLW